VSLICDFRCPSFTYEPCELLVGLTLEQNLAPFERIHQSFVHAHGAAAFLGGQPLLIAQVCSHGGFDLLPVALVVRIEKSAARSSKGISSAYQPGCFLGVALRPLDPRPSKERQGENKGRCQLPENIERLAEETLRSLMLAAMVKIVYRSNESE